MAFEELVIQGGALGIVAFSTYFNQIHMKKAIENNTKALIEVKAVTQKCTGRK